jgi:hypothetical protein
VAAFQERLAGFLERPSAERERRRGNDVIHYDLRPLVLELAYVESLPSRHCFVTVMRSEPGATGRPDELLAELGLADAPRRIARRSLSFRTDGA